MGVVFSAISVSFNCFKMDDNLVRWGCKEILNNGFLAWKSEDPSEDRLPLSYVSAPKELLKSTTHLLIDLEIFLIISEWFEQFLHMK